MPNSLALRLLDRVEELEKKVAILLSWHKFQVAMLGLILAAAIKIMFK